MKTRLVVVIPAKNEEKSIGRTLKFLVSQTLQPDEIIVINDGSTDKTKDIAEKFGCTVIDIVRKEFVATGTPILAAILNVGLRKARKLKPDYVAIVGADHLLPKHYFETIVTRMDEDEKIAIASGIIKGEKTRSFAPRGSGRIVRGSWWNRYKMQYPTIYGWETWLIYRALKDGYKVKVYKDLVTYTTRGTSFNPRKLYYYGKGMRALNYSLLYVLGRALLASKQNPLNGLMLLKGYFSKVEEAEDIKDFMKKAIKAQIREIIKEIIP